MKLLIGTFFFSVASALVPILNVEAYLAEAPGLAQRGQAFAAAVGDAFPAVWLPDPAVEAFARALEGDLPTVLRRSWEDTYDDLVRSR